MRSHGVITRKTKIQILKHCHSIGGPQILVFHYILYILSQLERMLFCKNRIFAFFFSLLGLIRLCSILLRFFFFAVSYSLEGIQHYFPFRHRPISRGNFSQFRLFHTPSCIIFLIINIQSQWLWRISDCHHVNVLIFIL
jgi:hypothetical protein